jgi:hypothetical protein
MVTTSTIVGVHTGVFMLLALTVTAIDRWVGHALATA